MIKLKSPHEIKVLKEGGAFLAAILNDVAKQVKPGVTTEELNEYAEERIAALGGRPSFKGYKASWAKSPFPSALCTSLNNEVVHGLPVPSRKLQAGDIIGIDCGLEYKKLFTDAAVSVPVGTVSKDVQKLLRVTYDALYRGIEAIRPGAKIKDISRAVQSYVEDNGFQVVRQLVGHGVGYSAHEDPQIPNYVDPHMPAIELVPGMVLAIEPMVVMGDWSVETLADDWTVATIDGSLAGHFEHTVAVTEKGYEILTEL